MRSSIYGFTDYEIDVVIKFGGSITRDLAETKRLLEEIAYCARLGHTMLVVPGGGRPDKTIEAIDRELSLEAETAHDATALAQDQTGMILCDRAFSTAFRACRTLRECRAALKDRLVPVLLPSRLLTDLDPVAMTWDITSDAVAAWCAWLVDAPRLAILTDIDGIYEPGSVGVEGARIEEIAPVDLVSMGTTSVDRCAVAWIGDKAIETVVLNGRHPERLRQWLLRQPFIGTLVSNDSVRRMADRCQSKQIRQ